ncbi:uncharacterized protein [Centruroides vittatus]|uniref:uncharacterized protein n=1 Tax=Centruroides vittatus TaxID=120091 RepID=UPI00350FF8DD
MGKEILNIIDSSKAAMELIVDYDNQWKESFKWLNELYEEMKLKLINDKRFLLRNTPAKRKRKIKNIIPSSPIKKESNSSSTSLKLLEGSKVNLDDSSLGIRKSKRIALKGITNQSMHKGSDFVYSTIKSKRIRQSSCRNDDACMNNIKTQINKRLSITTEPCVEEEKINANETKVLQSVSKNSSSLNKKISKDEDVSENKENQLSKTPLKYKNTNLSNLSTPSVKHRIQTYEEHIKTMNTPKFPVKATRKSSSVRKSLHHKLFKRSRSLFKSKNSLSKKRKSKSCSLSKNDSNKTSIISMENCKNLTVSTSEYFF